MSDSGHVLKVENLDHSFSAPGGDRIQVLRQISFSIDEGEFVAVRGPSGCGKTTLLLTCGAMLQPTSGTVKVAGQHIYSLSGRERIAFRAKQIGYLFQTLELVPYLSLLDNIRIVKGVKPGVAAQWLDRLGLADRADHKP
ncbi:MAG: ATP-binding cassette domain-containing protein, partial [Planctomycetota bacterium]